MKEPQSAVIDHGVDSEGDILTALVQVEQNVLYCILKLRVQFEWITKHLVQHYVDNNFRPGAVAKSESPLPNRWSKPGLDSYYHAF